MNDLDPGTTDVMAHDQPRASVLLVEDEEMNRTLVRAMLKRSEDPRLAQLQITDAPTVASARSALADRTFEIILLDARLPDGDGLDVAREMPADMPDRPWIIGFSASVLADQRASALEAGCDAFLGKPFRAGELREVMAAALNRRAASSEAPAV